MNGRIFPWRPVLGRSGSSGTYPPTSRIRSIKMLQAARTNLVGPMVPSQDPRQLGTNFIPMQTWTIPWSLTLKTWLRLQPVINLSWRPWSNPTPSLPPPTPNLPTRSWDLPQRMKNSSVLWIASTRSWANPVPPPVANLQGLLNCAPTVIRSFTTSLTVASTWTRMIIIVCTGSG